MSQNDVASQKALGKVTDELLKKSWRVKFYYEADLR